jgi:hypothetical protein
VHRNMKRNVKYALDFCYTVCESIDRQKQSLATDSKVGSPQCALQAAYICTSGCRFIIYGTSRHQA